MRQATQQSTHIVDVEHYGSTNDSVGEPTIHVEQVSVYVQAANDQDQQTFKEALPQSWRNTLYRLALMLDRSGISLSLCGGTRMTPT